MRIAQVAPLYESVPPRRYGGAERVVSYLTEELVRQGHEVTLFASSGSVTAARLVAPYGMALRRGAHRNVAACSALLLEEVFERAAGFDLLHFHGSILHFPLARRQGVPHVTTLHGRLEDQPDLVPLYRKFAGVSLVSVSDAQRGPLPWLPWVATVYNGIPADLYTFRARPGGYLAFLGRAEKGLESAVAIAGCAGLPLKVAVQVRDEEHFRSAIRPLLRPHVELLGEIGDAEKGELLGGALALLFPVDWLESFGLAMVEALACGTPVVAFRRGAVPEVIADGETGFLCDTVAEAVAAVARVPTLSRARCRRVFEERFTAERMAREYVALYRALVERALTAAGSLA
jgi:glycosyltransferase involved in cell wall biosynthesis